MDPSTPLPQLETFGERLTWAMNKATPRLKNPEVAKVAGTTDETVSRWRGGANVRVRRVGAIVKLLRDRGVPVTEQWLSPEDSGRRDEMQIVPPATPGFSKAERVWLARFRAELLDLDATEEETRAAELLLQVPELVSFVRSHSATATPLDAMRWLASHIEAEVRQRHGITERTPKELEKALGEALRREAPDSEVLAIVAEFPLDTWVNVADLRARASPKAKSARESRGKRS